LKKYNPGQWVSADKKKIKQLVWNLLNNAVKALNGNGEIEINLVQDHESVLMSIQDFGVGMDRDELEKIFTPFYSKFAFGIGMGLAFAARAGYVGMQAWKRRPQRPSRA
jgi:signal transduction histidine kinase